MQRSRALFLGSSVALAAIVGFWVFASGAVPSPPPTPGTPPELPGEVSLPPGAADPVAMRRGLLVRIDVTDHERYLPPAVARVRVDGADGREWPVRVLAGAGAGFDATGSAGPAVVRIDGPDRSFVRHVVLPEDERIAYRTLGPVAIAGLVHGPDGMPLRGARVWFGERGPDGARLEFETDATGAFAGEALGGAGVPFLVQAAGCLLHHAQLELTSSAEPLEVRLQAGCAVDVQLAGVAKDLGRARLFVLPASDVTSELANWPFWLQSEAGGVPFDGSGRASVEGLPRHGSVRMWVAHPEAPGGVPAEVSLKGERVRTVVPISYAVGLLHDRVVDEEGAPIASASVFALPGSLTLPAANASRLLPPHLELRGGCATRSDGDGGFMVGLPGERERVRLLLRAPGRAGRELRLTDAGSGPFVLPLWRGGEPEFSLSPPAPGEPWTAATDLSGGVVERLSAGSAFRLSLPHAGRFSFVLRTFDGEELVASRSFVDVPVTGPLELASPTRP